MHRKCEWRITNCEYGSPCALRVASLFALFHLLFASGAAASPAPSVRAAEAARIELIQRLSPSVASLFTKDNHIGGGSGVIIDAEGYGLTNFHVVAPMLPQRLGDVGLHDGKLREIEVLGMDPGGDVAVFRFTKRESFTAVEFGDANDLRIGDPCVALGNPFGLADDYTPTATLGIVSGLHRYQAGTRGALTYSDCIQVDTSINPGNSGGPLFDLNGRLVGINGRVAIEERGRVNVGVGFAITINQIRRFLPALRAGLSPAHGSAGFIAADADGGIVIDQVEDGSVAYRAGIRNGDRLVRFAGVDIQSANHFLSLLGTFPADWPVEMIYRRLEKTEKVRFRLDALPLPDLTRGRQSPAANRFDPYAETAVTRSANREAVRKALKSYARAMGGADGLDDIQILVYRGKRFLVSKPGDAGAAFAFTHQRPAKVQIEPTAPPDAIEEAIRWRLLQAAADKPDRDCKVVGGDEIRGNIAVVIEDKIGTDFSFTAAFDDANGRLLAVEFNHATSGKRVRYEYDDYRRVRQGRSSTGALKLPYRRWTLLDDTPFAEDQFEVIQIQEKPQ
ncbi:MAG TPA: trypsin-like peptidase domain-containing protein [Phycisphaerae bacterium]|nr:trypsin-like peptidase domain-containing protein [Phycisphaerae bacterium]